MLLNQAEGFAMASHAKGGCKATPPEQLALLLLRLLSQSSTIALVKALGALMRGFQGLRRGVCRGLDLGTNGPVGALHHSAK